LRNVFAHISVGILFFIMVSCSSSKPAVDNLSGGTTYMQNCKITFDGFDKTLRKERKELELEYLFGFTSTKLKPVFKDRDLVECKASLTKLDEDIYFRLNIEIAAPNASSTYGLIPKGNILVIDLINGDKIYSYSAATSKGKYDSQIKKTIYDAIYLIENKDELKNREIDKIGIMWTTGFEEYPIYEVDFLMRQFKCLGN